MGTRVACVCVMCVVSLSLRNFRNIIFKHASIHPLRLFCVTLSCFELDHDRRVTNLGVNVIGVRLRTGHGAFGNTRRPTEVPALHTERPITAHKLALQSQKCKTR